MSKNELIFHIHQLNLSAVHFKPQFKFKWTLYNFNGLNELYYFIHYNRLLSRGCIKTIHKYIIFHKSKYHEKIK